MALLEPAERRFAAALSRLTFANPFLTERVELEEAALGDAFERTGAVWSVDADLDGLNPNLRQIDAGIGRLLPALRERLVQGCGASDADLEVYDELVLYHLYSRTQDDWRRLIDSPKGAGEAYRRFAAEAEKWFGLPGVALPTRHDAPFLFAWGFQMRRAFHHTFRHLYGSSLPAARLRAAVWESIFTHDRRRYRRVLWDRMEDLATLVVGPSGTGKELVARAIGLSRFIPFDPEAGRFVDDYERGFQAVNLSALSPTLIESELFGHARGAYTGALADRTGWLEACGALGTVFLDEIGELAPALQVKLLRVLQARTFQRLGETEERRFEGKIVAATHCDLAAEIAAGRFREDVYYRLCSDVIRTPSLSEQLRDEPGDLRNLILVLARRWLGADEAEVLAGEVNDYVLRELGADYAWPGNIRELEQCVRNVLVRREYHPANVVPGASGLAPAAALAADVARGTLDADELLRRYTTLVYHLAGSYEEASRRLGIDRRTVKARVDPALLAMFRNGDGL
jgi:transcriptional regulator with AAA-type ATPase domain